MATATEKAARRKERSAYRKDISELIKQVKAKTGKKAHRLVITRDALRQYTKGLKKSA